MPDKTYDIDDLWMEEFEILYCLNKQLSCMEYIHTNYGEIPLDDEMRDIIKSSLEKLLEKRLKDTDNLTNSTFNSQYE